MGRSISNLHFRSMALTFKLRDIVSPRERVLDEVGIEPGYSVLDFGCGPGSYVAPVAGLVGESGKVYALDIHPLAVRSVERLVEKEGLRNVETILSDGDVDLPGESVDVVLLYDTYHALEDPEHVLEELHRVLKPGGILSFSDHHLSGSEALERMASKNLFEISGEGEKTYSFKKIA